MATRTSRAQRMIPKQRAASALKQTARPNANTATAKTALTVTKVDNQWTFLTNHSHVLICLARQPDIRLRDVAMMVGITERAVQRIIADLEEAGVLSRERTGRRNQYTVNAKQPLRHSIESHRSVRDLLDLVM